MWEKKEIQSCQKGQKKFVWKRTLQGGSMSLVQVGSCIKLKLTMAVMLSNCCYKRPLCFVLRRSLFRSHFLSMQPRRLHFFGGLVVALVSCQKETAGRLYVTGSVASPT